MNVLHYSQNKTKYLIKLLLLVKIYKKGKEDKSDLRPENVQIQMMDSVSTGHNECSNKKQINLEFCDFFYFFY